MTETLERFFAQPVFDFYFKPKAWENGGKIYKPLGVRFFKRFIPDSGDIRSRELKLETGKYLRINGSSSDDLLRWERRTRVDEVIHTAGLVGTYPLIRAGFKANFWLGLGAAALNVAVNAYPILLQRYNRARLYKAFEQSQKLGH